MAKGWIRLHRRLQDCEIWANNQPFDMRSAWVDLLMMANHKETTMLFDYEQIVVERGQLITSVRQLSARWSWSKDRTLKYLRTLERLEMIHRDSNNKRTLITIDNYGIYQDDRDTDQDTDTDTGKDTGSPQTRMIKNVKNVNNNRAFQKPTVEEVRAYCQERNNTVDPETFVDYYESKNWMIGKNKMKDWKAAVRTWERYEKTRGKSFSAQKVSKFNNFDQRKYNFDELESDVYG